MVRTIASTIGNILVPVMLCLLFLCGCSSDQTPPSFQEVQSLPANGGRDFRYFTIGQDRFLALAETWDGTTPDVDSHIYRWNGTQFAEFQAIPTHWATEWEFFTIAGNSYLVVANNHTTGTYNLDSQVYRWAGTQFVPFQAIPTLGASGWKFFTIGTDSFLAVANNGGNYRNYNVNSVVYKWNGTQFVVFQSIPTNAALRWEFFTIGADSFLAVANYSTDFTTTFNIDSRIYRWDGTQFVEFQAIPTSGAHYWKFFAIGGDSFLAVANLHSGPNRTNLEINSKIFKWDGAQFIEFQDILTTGAVSWDFAALNGNYYLAAASWKNDAGSFQLDSKVLRWNGSRFEEYLTVPGIGASDCAFYTMDGSLYLGVANVGGSSGPKVDSKLYRLVM
jgi:uncharacterized protein